MPQIPNIHIHKAIAASSSQCRPIKRNFNGPPHSGSWIARTNGMAPPPRLKETSRPYKTDLLRTVVYREVIGGGGGLEHTHFGGTHSHNHTCDKKGIILHESRALGDKLPAIGGQRESVQCPGHLWRWISGGGAFEGHCWARLKRLLDEAVQQHRWSICGETY